MPSKSLIFLLSTLLGVFCGRTYAQEDCVAPKHYSEIGCKPVLEEEENCPKRFDCFELLDRKDNECYYQGLPYKEGDSIPANLTETACQTSCFCREGNFKCSYINCPESQIPDRPSCLPQASTNNCCDNTFVCDETEIDKLAKCYVDGWELFEGQIFNTKSCHTCICAKGYNNTTRLEENPNCRLINCGIELFYSKELKKGCTPIYHGTVSCCPSGWRCPSDSDTVLESEQQRTTEYYECSFGNLKLKLGDRLSPKDNPVICECSHPPMLTCLQPYDIE